MKPTIPDERIKAISFSAQSFELSLMDGRNLEVPLSWFPRLASARKSDLADVQVVSGGFALHWPRLDEDLEISGLLAGNPAPEQRTATAIDATAILAYRRSSGLTQAGLASVLGVRKATISDWEKEKSAPSPLAQAKLRDLIRRSELANGIMPPPLVLARDDGVGDGTARSWEARRGEEPPVSAPRKSPPSVAAHFNPVKLMWNAAAHRRRR